MMVKLIDGSKNTHTDTLSHVFQPGSDQNQLLKYSDCVWWPIDGTSCTPNLFV